MPGLETTYPLNGGHKRHDRKVETGFFGVGADPLCLPGVSGRWHNRYFRLPRRPCGLFAVILDQNGVFPSAVFLSCRGETWQPMTQDSTLS